MMALFLLFARGGCAERLRGRFAGVSKEWDVNYLEERHMARRSPRLGSLDSARESLMEETKCERMKRHLENRGVPSEWAVVLAARLEQRVEGLDRDAYELVLEGVADAFGGRWESRDALTDRLCEVREIERLMAAFAEELGKLDEVLEVLAAHVRRMRLRSEAAGSQNFH